MASSAAWLPGHTDSVLCCAVIEDRKLLASGGEDGTICLSDLSTLKPVGRIDAAGGSDAAVPALCCHPGQEAGLFAAAGAAVLQLDLRAGLGPEATCRTFQVNSDEVNGLAATDANGGWLAAADDAGEVAVVSLAPTAGGAGDAAASGSAAEAGAAAGAATAAARAPQYKTLRRGHSNIASAVAFRPHRPWELLSGALDSTVVKWDFNRLRPVQSWSLAGEATASGGQLFNPPMVHSIAVPQTDDRGVCRLMAVARGDGAISVYDADFKPPAAAAGSGRKGGGKARQQQRQRQQASPGAPGRLALLGREQGGHGAAVNCVSFIAASSWQQLLSAGNDCRLLLWNWQAAAAAAEEASAAADEAAAAGNPGAGGSLRQGGAQAPAGVEQAAAAAAVEAGGGNEDGMPLLAAEHRHPRKINWACSSDLPGCGYSTFIADTGKRITALALR